MRAHNNQRVCGMQIDDNGIIHIGWKRKINAFFCCCYCYSNCTWSWFPVLQISRRKNMMWNEREMIFKIHKSLTNCYIINWDMFTVWNLHNNHFATSLFYQCNTNHSTLLSKKTTKQDLFSCNHIKLIPEANLSHFTCLFVDVEVIHLSAFWCEEMQIFFCIFFAFLIWFRTLLIFRTI